MMWRNAFFCVASWLTILGLLLASCAPAAPPTPTAKPTAAPPKAEATTAKPTVAPAAPPPTPKPAAEQPRYGGSLALPAINDPPSLDPHRNAAQSFFGPVAPMYNGIARYDQSNKVVPDLAERWEVSPDGKAYTFHLRKGVKWHDGKSFTSADAELSLKRIMEYESLGSLLQIENVEGPDENTLRVSLRYRQSSFLVMLAHGRILVGPKQVFDARGDLRQNVIGTGPFRLREYLTGVSFRFERNKEYFVPGRPYLDALSFYVIRDTSTRLAGFRTGRLQIYGHPPTNGELLPRGADLIRREMPQAIVRPYEQLAGYGVQLVWHRPPWRDVRVRRAAFMAIDREKFVEVVSEGAGSIGVSVFSGEWALPREELMKMPGFRKSKDADIVEAKRLLAEAGYPDGLKSALLVRSDVPLVEKAAVLAKEQLAKIGIDLTLQIVEFAVLVELREKGLNFDATVMNPNVGLSDPDVAGRYIHTKLGKFFAGGEDDKILELYTKQSQAATDRERKELVFELQRRIAEVVPHIFLAWHGAFIALSPQVRDYPEGGPLHAHLRMQDVWLSQ